MAINAYVGRPGSGKSYSVVAHVILPAIQAGIPVVTNIPLNVEAIQKDNPLMPVASLVYLFESSAYDQDDFWAKPIKGAVYALDEAWRALPAGVTYDRLPDSKKEFLSEHRHCSDESGRSIEIILITQDLKQIMASIRPMIDKTFSIEKLNNVGLNKRFRVSIYNGHELKDIINKQFYNYSPNIYKYYNTHTKSDNVNSHIDESSLDDRASIFSNPMIKYGMPISLLITPFLIYSIYHQVTKPKDNTTKPVEPVIHQQTIQPEPIPIIQPQQTGLSYFDKLLSNELRYVAHIKTPEREYSLIQITGHSSYLSTDTLSREGYTCISTESYVKIIKGNNTYYAEKFTKPDQSITSKLDKYIAKE
jgi:zona occludens toxin